MTLIKLTFVKIKISRMTIGSVTFIRMESQGLLMILTSQFTYHAIQQSVILLKVVAPPKINIIFFSRIPRLC
jgi:hypothetical protein